MEEILKNSKIYPFLPDILNTIVNNKASLVKLPTGYGKSTYLIMALSKFGKCFISVPRISIVKGLITSFKQMFDYDIGYSYEGITKYTDENKIIFATSKHVANKVERTVHNGNCIDMTFTDFLIIDEAHEMNDDIQMMVYIWKHCRNKGAKVPNIVLISATANLELLPEAVVYEKDEPLFYQTLYHDKNFKIGDKKIFKDIAKLLNTLDGRFPLGSFIVFIAGQADIDELKNQIGKKDNWDIYPFIGKIEGNYQKLLEDPEYKKRRIIIATKAIEAGVTIPTVFCVIDTLWDNSERTSELGGKSVNLEFIPQSSSKQRLGRAGRGMENKGAIGYRMCTKEFFEQLPVYKEPDINTKVLDPIVLKLLKLKFDYMLLLGEKNYSRILKAIKNLSRLRLIVQKENGEYAITERGVFANELSFIGIDFASLIFNWKSRGYPVFPIIIISCIAYQQNWYNKIKTDKKLNEERYKIFKNRFVGFSDIETYANIWHKFINDRGSIYSSEDFVTRWSNFYYINDKAMIKALNDCKQVINNCNKLFQIEGEGIKQVAFVPDKFMFLFKITCMEIFSNYILKFVSKNVQDMEYRTLDGTIIRVSKDMNKYETNPPQIIIALNTVQMINAKSNYRSSTTVDIPSEIIKLLIERNGKAIDEEKVIYNKEKLEYLAE